MFRIHYVLKRTRVILSVIVFFFCGEIVISPVVNKSIIPEEIR